jgi:hypothetical protein
MSAEIGSGQVLDKFPVIVHSRGSPSGREASPPSRYAAPVMRQTRNATAADHTDGPAGRQSTRQPDPRAATLRVGRAATTAATTVLALGALSGLAACGYNSPVQTQLPYQPADGVEVNLGPIAIRNLLIVGTTASAPGRMAGLIVNSAATAQTVTITTPDGGSAKAAVPAGATLSLSEGTGAITLPKAGAPAGSIVQLKLSTPTSGTDSVGVPVLAPQLYYATLTPTSTPTSGGAASTPGGLPSTATTGGSPASESNSNADRP